MIASPIALSSFFDAASFGWSTASFFLPDNRRFNRTAGGLVIGSERGARLWQGSIQMIPLGHRDASFLDARMSLLTGSGMSFLIYDGRVAYPKADLDGSILGAATPVLNTVNANMNDITISGLPAGYVISNGDMIGYTYGSSPVRRALHKVAVGGSAANGSGVSPTLQVTPPIRPGYVAGATLVTLIKPAIAAQVVPGSYVPPNYQPGVISTPGSFDFIQTLRG